MITADEARKMIQKQLDDEQNKIIKSKNILTNTITNSYYYSNKYSLFIENHNH